MYVCMSVCMYVCIYVCMYVYIYIYMPRSRLNRPFMHIPPPVADHRFKQTKASLNVLMFHFSLASSLSSSLSSSLTV